MATRKSYHGIPIKDRSTDDIRAALANQEDTVTAQFLALHKYARQHTLGLTKLAHQTGIPSSILSQCFNASYEGDYAATATRIETFFWRLEQKALYGGLREFCDTQLAQGIWSILEKTRIIRRIQIIQGPEQVGKTRACEEYAARNNSGRTVHLKLSGGSRAGCGDFIWSVADRLGLPYTIKLREKRLRIRQALESCDLLIIDEAHLIFSCHDRAARDFWDYLRTDIFADGARGVVLVVTNSDMLQGIQDWRKRSHYNIGQLLGRMRNEIMQIDPAEDITESDVRLLIERYYRPGKAAVNKLHSITMRPQLGHFGLLEDILNEAWTRAKSARKKLTDEIVIQTATQIINTLKTRKEMYT